MKTATLLQISIALSASIVACEGAITVNVAGLISSISGGTAPGINGGEQLQFQFSPFPPFESSVTTVEGYNSYENAVTDFSFVINDGAPSMITGIASEGSLTLNEGPGYEGLGIHFLEESLLADDLSGYEMVDWSISLLKIGPEGEGVVTPPSSATADLFNMSSWDLAGGSIAFRRSEPYDYFTVEYTIETIAMSGEVSVIPEPNMFSMLAAVGIVGMFVLRRRR